MNPELLQRIFNLVRDTKDKLIVLDPQETARAFVVMDLEQYEELRLKPSGPPHANVARKIVVTSEENTPQQDLTPQKLSDEMDNVNRDIAALASIEQANKQPAAFVPQTPADARDSLELEEHYYLEPTGAV